MDGWWSCCHGCYCRSGDGLGTFRSIHGGIIIKPKLWSLRAFLQFVVMIIITIIAMTMVIGRDASSQYCSILRLSFLSMGKFLLLGAIITALFKTFTPAGILNIFESSEILAIIMMMVLAIVLSVCSEATPCRRIFFQFSPRGATRLYGYWSHG